MTTDQIGDAYERDYADERVSEKMLKAAEWAYDYLSGVMGPHFNADSCRDLQYAILTFLPSGKRRKRLFFFRGTRFNYSEQAADEEQAERNIKMYHTLLASSAIPPAPNRWTL